MDIASVSNTTMVTAAVIYLFAAVAHAAEWAAAREPGGRAPRRGSAKQQSAQPEPALVGAATPAGASTGLSGGTPADAVAGTPSTDTPAADAPGGTVISEQPAPADGPGSDDRDPDADRTLLRVDRFGRIGIALTLVAVLVHAIAVITRGLAAERFPWGNMYEFVSTTLLFVVLVHLFLALRHGQRWLGLLVTFLSTIGMGLAVTVFYVDVSPLVPSLHSVWFRFHIGAAAISAAAFNVGAIATVLYLVKSRAERRGEVTGYLAKLPSAKRIDLLAYRAHAFAFPLWTFTIAAGAIWAQYAWGRFWGWDPKETMSLVTWVIYACYLHARATAGWRGGPAAAIALVGVVAFWFNFIGINLLVSGLHSYAGV